MLKGWEYEKRLEEEQGSRALHDWVPKRTTPAMLPQNTGSPGSALPWLSVTGVWRALTQLQCAVPCNTNEQQPRWVMPSASPRCAAHVDLG